MACQMKRPLVNLIYITKEPHHGRPRAQPRRPAVEFELGVHAFVCSLHPTLPQTHLLPLNPSKITYTYTCARGRLALGDGVKNAVKEKKKEAKKRLLK